MAEPCEQNTPQKSEDKNCHRELTPEENAWWAREMELEIEAQTLNATEKDPWIDLRVPNYCPACSEQLFTCECIDVIITDNRRRSAHDNKTVTQQQDEPQHKCSTSRETRINDRMGSEGHDE